MAVAAEGAVAVGAVAEEEEKEVDERTKELGLVEEAALTRAKRAASASQTCEAWAKWHFECVLTSTAAASALHSHADWPPPRFLAETPEVQKAA